MTVSKRYAMSAGLRTVLLGASSAAALSIGGAATAQTATQVAAAQKAPGSLTEIIVTATRRSQSVQKTSLAITVLGASELARAGVTQAKDLTAVLPGVEIGSAGGAAQVFIRGVGTVATNGLAEEAVAINIDGIYISRPTALSDAFYDLSRVEVLKGPQGTLYGKNATGGAINVITNDPSTSKLSGSESLEVGDYGLVKNQFVLNVPVSDQFALRGAVSYARHDGYLSDGTDDENDIAGRLKALIKPNEDVRIVLSADFTGLYGRGDGPVVLPNPNSSNPWEGASSAPSNALLANSTLGGSGPNGHFPFLGPYGLLSPIKNDIGQNTRQWGLGSDISWNLGFGTLTSVTGYRQDPANYTTYVPGFLVSDTETDAQISQEFRLSGQYGPLKWVVGAYYFNENQSLSLYDNGGLVSSGLLHVSSLTDNSYAGFGEVTYSITPRLRAILGDRYTRELKSIDGSYTSGSTHAVYPFAHQSNEHADNWRAGLEYDVLPQSMAYATASTGFKSGGFYPNIGNDAFKPEKLTAYELGIKNRFFENRLELNLELYDWDYQNRQFSHLGEVTTATGQSLNATILGTYNAGKSTLHGIDTSVKYLLTDNDKFTLELEYNSTIYNSFIYSQPYGFATAASNSCVLAPNVKGTQTINCSGRPLTRAPLWSATVGYEHDFDLASSGSLQASVRTHLSSSYYLNVDYVPSEKAPGYTQTDFDLTYRPVVGNWSIAAYVHNLEDSAVYSGGVEQPFASGLTYATILPPRTFGGRFTIGF